MFLANWYFNFVEKIRVRVCAALIRLFYNSSHIIVATNNSTFLVIVLLTTWIFEWFFIIDDTLEITSWMNYIFPYRISMLLMLIFLFFINSWIISVWRRSIFGKFTRGDRELWLKGFSSFWFFELSTLLGFIIAAAWMNWGPTPLFKRKFNISRQGFLFELVIFTYLTLLINLMRVCIKLNGWKNQIIWIVITLLFLSTLIWRDILVFIGRESITIGEGCRWKFINSSIVLYSLSKPIWVSTYLSHKNTNHDLVNHYCYTLTQFLTLVENDPQIDIFKNQIGGSLYNSYQSIIFTKLNSKMEYIRSVSVLYYPTRIGFFPKRISMWTFFLFLKIWHHLMLIIWWYYYLIRLYSTKKVSNIFLAVCAFNTYCCFLIIFSIYIYCLFPKLVMFFRFFKDRPKMLNFQTFLNWRDYIVDYFTSLLFSDSINLDKIHRTNSSTLFSSNILTNIWEEFFSNIKKNYKKFGTFNFNDFIVELRSSKISVFKRRHENIRDIISFISGL